MSTRKVWTLPVFEVTEVCEMDDEGAREVKLTVDGELHIYYIRRVQDGFKYTSFREPHCYNKYPIALDNQGIPWAVGNLFLLDSAENSISSDTRGLKNMAADLADIGQYFDRNSIDIYDFPVFKKARPTYQYSLHQLAAINRHEVSSGLANRRISTMVKMYKYLSLELKFVFPNAPWVIKTTYVPTKVDNNGFPGLHRVEHTDLTHPKSASRKIPRGYIRDGEKLKPLNQEEQTALIGILLESGRVQMCLMFFLGLFTGLRMQTICTLRARFFLSPLQSEYRAEIPCGPGTGNDTKKDKERVVRVASWLYRAIHIYVKSPEWARRNAMYEKKHGIDPNGAAIFHTAQGNPFYNTKREISIFDSKSSSGAFRDGGAVRTFIQEVIKPKMREIFGKEFHFKFHNTRATFGTNFCTVARSVKPRPSEAQIIEDLAEEMWHNDVSVTKGYVKFEHDEEFRKHTQMAYETDIETMARDGMKKLYDD